MFDGLFFASFIINKPLVNPLLWLLHRLDEFVHLMSDHACFVSVGIISPPFIKQYVYILGKK